MKKKLFMNNVTSLKVPLLWILSCNCYGKCVFQVRVRQSLVGSFRRM